MNVSQGIHCWLEDHNLHSKNTASKPTTYVKIPCIQAQNPWGGRVKKEVDQNDILLQSLA
jgi:hypothetical protein